MLLDKCFCAHDQFRFFHEVFGEGHELATRTEVKRVRNSLKRLKVEILVSKAILYLGDLRLTHKGG